MRAADRVRRVQYAREERDRLHKERVDAYSKFYLAADQVGATLRSIIEPDHPTELTVRRELWARFTTMVLVAEVGVLNIADEILNYTDGVIWRQEAFDAAAYRGLIHRFQRAARADVIGLVDLPSAPSEARLQRRRG
jgi:hypothetical protein